MVRSNDSFRDRMRQLKLWHWGMFCIIGAMVSRAVGMLQPPANSAEAAGRSVGVLLFMAVGVILILLHCVLRRKRRKKRQAVPVLGVASAGLPPRRSIKRGE